MKTAVREDRARKPVELPLGRTLEFLRLLWAIDHGFQTLSKRMETTLGVTGPQRLVIRILGRFPGLSAVELAEVLRIHPSTLSGILGRLQRRGLVNRRPHPRDRRRSWLGLTAKGRQLDVPEAGTLEEVVEAALSGQPRAKLLAVEEILGTIAGALDEALRTEAPRARAGRTRRRGERPRGRGAPPEGPVRSA